MMVFLLALSAGKISAQTENQPIAIWASDAGGFSNVGLFEQLELGMQKNNFCVSIRAAGSLSFYQSMRECGIQFGVIKGDEKVSIVISGGISKISGTIKGDIIQNDFLFGPIYNTVPYTTYGMPLEQKIIFHVNPHKYVYLGINLVEEVNPYNSYFAGMFSVYFWNFNYSNTK